MVQNPKRYGPLFILIGVAAINAIALSYSHQMGMMDWMHYFMGFLFSQFALLKLFNLEQFAEGFQMYDLIAKKSRGYALVYPFIELGLGLAYFSMVMPDLIHILTIIILGIGAYGVFRALKAGLDVRCACMGNILNVPLSTVTLTEDIGMGVMALIMLIAH